MTSQKDCEGYGSFGSDWDPDYDISHYGEPEEADILVADALIKGIVGKLENRLGTVGGMFEIGAARVLRTSGIATPLLAPDAHITYTDVGDTQIQATEEAVAKIRRGELGIWRAHQDAMATTDSRWYDAIANIGKHDVLVAHHNIDESPLPETELRVEGHVLCSHVSKKDAYENALENFLSSMTPLDVALRCFDVRSQKYRVGNKWFPGYPIDREMVEEEARRFGLKVIAICQFAVPEKHGKETDKLTQSTLTALGGAVLLNPATRTILL